MAKDHALVFTSSALTNGGTPSMRFSSHDIEKQSPRYDIASQADLMVPYVASKVFQPEKIQISPLFIHMTYFDPLR